MASPREHAERAERIEIALSWAPHEYRENAHADLAALLSLAERGEPEWATWIIGKLAETEIALGTEKQALVRAEAEAARLREALQKCRALAEVNAPHLADEIYDVADGALEATAPAEEEK